MAFYEIGSEPASVRARIDRLLAKINEAYPDKKISGLQTDHKKWAETAGDVRKLLGYESIRDFFAAYGYDYDNSKCGRPGKDRAADYAEVKARLESGTMCLTVKEYKEMYPDIEKTINLLSQVSQGVFGMTFKDKLVQDGLLEGESREERIARIATEELAFAAAREERKARIATEKLANAAARALKEATARANAEWDGSVVYEEFKEKIASGAKYPSLKAIQDAYPDLASTVKLLIRKSETLFGCTLRDKLILDGLAEGETREERKARPKRVSRAERDALRPAFKERCAAAKNNVRDLVKFDDEGEIDFANGVFYFAFMIPFDEGGFFDGILKRLGGARSYGIQPKGSIVVVDEDNYTYDPRGYATDGILKIMIYRELGYELRVVSFSHLKAQMRTQYKEYDAEYQHWAQMYQMYSAKQGPDAEKERMQSTIDQYKDKQFDGNGAWTISALPVDCGTCVKVLLHDGKNYEYRAYRRVSAGDYVRIAGGGSGKYTGTWGWAVKVDDGPGVRRQKLNHLVGIDLALRQRLDEEELGELVLMFGKLQKGVMPEPYAKLKTVMNRSWHWYDAVEEMHYAVEAGLEEMDSLVLDAVMDNICDRFAIALDLLANQERIPDDLGAQCALALSDFEPAVADAVKKAKEIATGEKMVQLFAGFTPDVAGVDTKAAVTKQLSSWVRYHNCWGVKANVKRCVKEATGTLEALVDVGVTGYFSMLALHADAMRLFREPLKAYAKQVGRTEILEILGGE
ncbi:MAG: hypothetical protein LBS91_06060 [Clostridiales Family XIII bacterium]|jgi:hypothetical protein|nr:hypothetical protein [Clostridiales Family XIII bacterium]